MAFSPIVLIVDDMPSGRQSLESLLQEQGYELFLAESGPEALRLAAELHPDVILLDVMMPGMDGYEVLGHLRADPTLAEVPVVLVTALDDLESRIKGIEAGADDFISKPFDRTELRAHVRTITRLNRYRNLTEEREKLRRLSHQMIDLQEHERRSIAMELHDEVGQSLTGLKHIMEHVRKSAREPNTTDQLDIGLGMIGELIERIRNLSLNLRPSMLDDFGLYPALSWLASRSREQNGMKISCNFNEFDEGRYPPAIETAVFRIAQEALTNIARHSKAKHAELKLIINPDAILFEACDDGLGFDPEVVKENHFSSGLSGMQERARMADGQLNIQSSPGKGTIIRATFPVKGVAAK
jgi:signal transduction histidine kinase